MTLQGFDVKVVFWLAREKNLVKNYITFYLNNWYQFRSFPTCVLVFKWLFCPVSSIKNHYINGGCDNQLSDTGDAFLSWGGAASTQAQPSPDRSPPAVPVQGLREKEPFRVASLVSQMEKVTTNFTALCFKTLDMIKLDGNFPTHIMLSFWFQLLVENLSERSLCFMTYNHIHHFTCFGLLNLGHYEVISYWKSPTYLVNVFKSNSFMLAKLWPCELLLILWVFFFFVICCLFSTGYFLL